jgi:deoxyribose-phosphate aldolase
VPLNRLRNADWPPSKTMVGPVDRKTLARMIDHSLLHPTLTDESIEAGCRLARKYKVATACVKPYSIRLACRVLEDSEVGVCAVVAFPHGNSTTAIKLKEAEEAVSGGAVEIDAVVNIGKVLGGDWQYVAAEIGTMNEVVTSRRAALKVIFENDYLEDRHILKLCDICSAEEVAFVKTSTGYGFVRQANGMYSYTGATDHDVQLMRANCPPTVGVKAAGGIRTLDDLLRVRQLGATRVGATATREILEEAERRGYS